MTLGQIMTPLDGAKLMAARGYPVFPCQPGAKVPKRKNWQRGATRDPGEIETIFAGAACNVGVPTDGHLVVDIDAHKGGLTWAHLSDLPPTFTVRTARGGLHYHYALPAGVDVGCSVEKIGPGIDTRANGGLVIAPGSKVGDGCYTVADPSPIAAAPAWLLELCQSYRTPKSTVRVLGELDTPGALESARSYLLNAAPEAIEGSGGDNTTYKVACAVKDRGVSPETALDLMLEHWNERCDPPWEPDDLAEIVAHAYRYGQAPAGRDNPEFGFVPIEMPRTEADDVGGLLEFSSDVSREDLLAASARDIVKGMIAPGMSATLYGETGVGKSHIALDLAFHIAHGLDYHGVKTRKVPVLYVQLEGIAGFRKRIFATAEKFGDPGAYFARLKLQVSLAKDAQGQKGAETIIRAVERLKLRTGSDSALVIIDTKARATAGDNENDGADMSAFAEKRQGYIARETDACVLVVHHLNKGGEYRGHSGQKAGDDLVLKVERGKVTAEKVKDGVEGPLFSFALEQVHLGHDRDGFPVTTCVVTKALVAASLPKAERTRKEPKEAATLRAAFLKVAQERAHPETGEPVNCAPIDAVRDEFFASYPTGEADVKKAGAAKRTAWWRAFRHKLPPDLKVRTFPSGELMWCERAEW